MKDLILFVVVFGAVVCGCGGSGTSTETVDSPEVTTSVIRLTADQETGRLLYETICWSCHGPAGRGDGPAVAAGSSPPPTFHTLDFATADTERIERWFRGELPGTSHPY
jgi:hypothetical protein